MDIPEPIVHVVGKSRANGPPLDATMAACNALTHASWFAVTTIPLFPWRFLPFAPRRSANTVAMLV
jgi:hypothetical protein